MKKNVAIGILAGLVILFLHLWQSAEIREESGREKIAELADIIKSYEEGRERDSLEDFKISYMSLELLNAEPPDHSTILAKERNKSEEAGRIEIENKIDLSAYFADKHGEVIRFWLCQR